MKRTVGRPLVDSKRPEKIRALLDKGLNDSEIARILKIGRSLVRYHRLKIDF